jgi:hypothetical protein
MGKNEEVVVNYIAITEHTSLWEISGGIKYGNLQNTNKSACIHPNYWIETTSLYFTRSVLLKNKQTLTTRKTPHS